MTGALYNIAIILSIVSLVASQDYSNTTTSKSTIYRGSDNYKYHGCYNETTQIQDSAKYRALADGTHLVKAGKMTVPMCLDFCTSNGTQYKYAGLEWSRSFQICLLDFFTPLVVFDNLLSHVFGKLREKLRVKFFNDVFFLKSVADLIQRSEVGLQ
ncbi:hypothetical protein HG531_001633 [Fusarium graminearum]|nr:hypothetical protein HG531_001633 [Fusarium graminearum]